MCSRGNAAGVGGVSIDIAVYCLFVGVFSLLAWQWRADTRLIEYNSGYELARRSILWGDKMTLADIVTGEMKMSDHMRSGALDFIDRHNKGYKT